MGIEAIQDIKTEEREYNLGVQVSLILHRFTESKSPKNNLCEGKCSRDPFL